MDKMNLLLKEKELTGSHSQVILGEVNDHCIRLAVNEKSTFDWHSHQDSDEVLFVLDGELEIRFLNRQPIVLEKLDSILIPKGVVHQTTTEKRTVNICFEKTEDSTVFQPSPEKVNNNASMFPGNKKNFIEWLNANNEKHANECIWEINDHCLKFAINSGTYRMHNHPNSDEAFIVINNAITLRFEYEEIELHEMDLFIVNKGVDHMPVAGDRAGIIFFESKNCQTIMI